MTTCLLSLGAGLMLMSAPVAASVCSTTGDCLAVVEAAQRDTRTISADFVQVKHLSLLEEPIVSSGHVLVKRPDRVLLRIEKPQPAIVRITKGQLEIPNLSERDRQALSMVPMAGMFSDVGEFFSGSIAGLREKFDVTATGDAGGIDVELIPRDESLKQTFRRIALRFEGPQALMHRIHMDDALGDSLDITLENVQRNVELPDTLFTGNGG